MTDSDWVHPVTLEGFKLRLRPLQLGDAEALHEVCPPETFAYFVSLQPSGTSLADFREYVGRRIQFQRSLSFVVEDQVSGRILGETAFMDIRPEAKGLEIGMTWYADEVKGTVVNPECKFLLLQHAFEELRAIRVALKTDARNVHSQNAIRKLGATYEGTLRNHGIQPDGTIRDTAFFSILPSEWPEIREKLLSRIKNPRTK